MRISCSTVLGHRHVRLASNSRCGFTLLLSTIEHIKCCYADPFASFPRLASLSRTRIPTIESFERTRIRILQNFHCTAFTHMSLSAKIRVLQAGWRMSPTSLIRAGGSGLRPCRCVDATVWRSSGSSQSGMGSRRDPACRSCTRRRICLVGER